jgi:hypothetical protein
MVDVLVRSPDQQKIAGFSIPATEPLPYSHPRLIRNEHVGLTIHFDFCLWRTAAVDRTSALGRGCVLISEKAGAERVYRVPVGPPTKSKPKISAQPAA